jgi:hypothetical protein
MLFKNSVRTSKRTQHFTITKFNWLMIFKKIIPAYTENHKRPINTKCIFTAGGTYSYHWALKCYLFRTPYQILTVKPNTSTRYQHIQNSNIICKQNTVRSSWPTPLLDQFAELLPRGKTRCYASSLLGNRPTKPTHIPFIAEQIHM